MSVPDYDFGVHDHVLDAFGLKGRLFASDVIDYVFVVEDDHVSPKSTDSTRSSVKEKSSIDIPSSQPRSCENDPAS